MKTKTRTWRLSAKDEEESVGKHRGTGSSVQSQQLSHCCSRHCKGDSLDCDNTKEHYIANDEEEPILQIATIISSLT